MNRHVLAAGHIRSFDERSGGVVERKFAAAQRNVSIAAASNAP
jgi:hypothetical protein